MSALKTIFGIDLRTLALFRISLATMIIVDLLFRARDLSAFYTDEGVLTRMQSMSSANPYRWSLHWMSGAEWAQGFLFVLAGFIAFLLLVGYRARLMAIVSWLLLISLQNRNEFLTSGGDNLLVIMTFWAMFLPISARFSIDAALHKTYQQNCNSNHEQNHQYFSLITMAVLLQVMYLYFFTAILKTGDAWRVTMDAAYYAVHLDQMATIVGHWMRNFPWLLTFGTYYVWYLEILAVFFIFSPVFHVQLRLITLALLVAMHGAFFFSLHIVLFPFIDFVSLSLFLPTAAWVWLGRFSQSEKRKGIRIYFDEDCGFCRKTCLILRAFLLPSSVPILPAQSDATIHEVMQRENTWVVVDHTGRQHLHWYGVRYLLEVSILFKPIALLFKIPIVMALGNRLYHWVANNRYAMSKLTERWLVYRPVGLAPSWFVLALGLYFFYIITYINIAGVYDWDIKKPQHVYVTEKLLRLDQRWDMFAPYPVMSSAMPVMPGTTRGGKAVDPYKMTMQPVTWEWPELLSWEFENYRWRKYVGRLRTTKNNTMRSGYGSYICNRWNNRDIPFRDKLASFEIYFDMKKTLPDGKKGEPKRVRAWRHWCYAEYAPGKPLSFFDK